jgi:hypothetical protein
METLLDVGETVQNSTASVIGSFSDKCPFRRLAIKGAQEKEQGRQLIQKLYANPKIMAVV